MASQDSVKPLGVVGYLKLWFLDTFAVIQAVAIYGASAFLLLGSLASAKLEVYDLREISAWLLFISVFFIFVTLSFVLYFKITTLKTDTYLRLREERKRSNKRHEIWLKLAFYYALVEGGTNVSLTLQWISVENIILSLRSSLEAVTDSNTQTETLTSESVTHLQLVFLGMCVGVPLLLVGVERVLRKAWGKLKTSTKHDAIRRKVLDEMLFTVSTSNGAWITALSFNTAAVATIELNYPQANPITNSPTVNQGAAQGFLFLITAIAFVLMALVLYFTVKYEAKILPQKHVEGQAHRLRAVFLQFIQVLFVAIFTKMFVTSLVWSLGAGMAVVTALLWIALNGAVIAAVRVYAAGTVDPAVRRSPNIATTTTTTEEVKTESKQVDLEAMKDDKTTAAASLNDIATDAILLKQADVFDHIYLRIAAPALVFSSCQFVFGVDGCFRLAFAESQNDAPSAGDFMLASLVLYILSMSLLMLYAVLKQKLEYTQLLEAAKVLVKNYRAKALSLATNVKERTAARISRAVDARRLLRTSQESSSSVTSQTQEE